MEGLAKHSPNWKMSTAEEAADNCMAVANKASIENGDGGMFLSHFGSRTQWV